MADAYTTKRPIHDQLISDILADWPTARTSGFIQALKTLHDAEYMQWMAEHEPKWFLGVSIIPDAYLIDVEERHVIIFEAVHSHDVDARKFGRINDIAWALDEDYYTLGLIRCTRLVRTAYCPTSMSIVNDREEIAARIPANSSWRIPDWQKFTTEYCIESHVKAGVLAA